LFGDADAEQDADAQDDSSSESPSLRQSNDEAFATAAEDLSDAARAAEYTEPYN